MLPSNIRKQLDKTTGRWLTQSCTIEAEVLGVDIYGAPVHQWAVVASGVKCRVIKMGRGDTREVGSQEALVEKYRLICPAGTALGIDQRVTVGGAVYQVVSVQSALTDAVDVQAEIVRVKNG